jgi:hypothetical protein
MNLQFYKQLDSEIIVLKVKGINKNSFWGLVVNNEGINKVGDRLFCTDAGYKPFAFRQLPEKPQPEATTTKDVELRLECLKLASNNKNGQSKDAILQLAEEYYEWITKPQ